MIAMSGCAKRNADRELARVLELATEHIRIHQQCIDTAETEAVKGRFSAGKRSLESFRDALGRLAHRRRP